MARPADDRRATARPADDRRATRKLPSHETLTTSVVLGQALFLLVGYVHAHSSSELRWASCHVSAMLDEPNRALMCALTSILPGSALVCLEIGRPAPARQRRTALAGVTALGILVTCAVPESSWFALHASAACVTFGAGMLLAWLVIPTRAMLLLSAACVVTGTFQGLKLLEVVPFPSVLLALGENVIIMGFGLSLSGPAAGAAAAAGDAARALSPAGPATRGGCGELSSHCDSGGASGWAVRSSARRFGLAVLAW